MENYIYDSELDVQSEAIVALIRWNINHKDKLLDGQKILNDMVLDQGKSSNAKAVYIIGEAKVKELISVLLEYFRSFEKEIQLEVIKASGKMEDERVVGPLVKHLESENLTQHVIQALLHLGDHGIKPLHKELESDNNSQETKNHIVYCLGKICNPLSIPILLKILETKKSSVSLKHSSITTLCLIKEKLRFLEPTDDPASLNHTATSTLILLREKMRNFPNKKNAEIMEKYFPEDITERISKSMVTTTFDIQNEYNYLQILKNTQNEQATKLLIDAISRLNQQKEEIALRCLELVSEPRTISKAAYNLKSKDKRERAEAIEALEGSCKLAGEFIEFLENKYLETNSSSPSQKINTVLTNLLTNYQNSWLQSCSIYAIGELRLKDLSPTLSSWYHLKKENRKHQPQNTMCIQHYKS